MATLSIASLLTGSILIGSTLAQQHGLDHDDGLATGAIIAIVVGKSYTVFAPPGATCEGNPLIRDTAAVVVVVFIVKVVLVIYLIRWWRRRRDQRIQAAQSGGYVINHQYGDGGRYPMNNWQQPQPGQYGQSNAGGFGNGGYANGFDATAKDSTQPRSMVPTYEQRTTYGRVGYIPLIHFVLR